MLYLDEKEQKAAKIITDKLLAFDKHYIKLCSELLVKIYNLGDQTIQQNSPELKHLACDSCGRIHEYSCAGEMYRRLQNIKFTSKI